MAEETQAVSSPAEVEDVFKGQAPTLAEYNHWHSTKELPERFKPAAESEPADTPEETETTEGESPEPAPDSEPEETQEPPPKLSPYEKRVKQLLAEKNQALAEKKELERKLAEKQGVQTDPSPAPAEATHAHPKPTVNDKNPDGTPRYADYEEVVEAIGRWAAKEERITWQREQVQLEAQKALKGKLDEARARYADADDVIFPANQAIQSAKIPQVIKEVIAQSAEFVDLLYVVGSDPEALKKFISLAQSDSMAALEEVFDYKRKIRDAFSRAQPQRDDKGKFTAPEVKKTSAPKPPSPVGGASSRAFDVSDESLSPEQWALKRNQDLQKRRG